MWKLWPRQAQFMTILSFDLQVLPWLSTYLNVSNCTSTPQEQLCRIVLKSMLNCRSYGLDKAQFMTILSFDFKVWSWPLTDLNKCFKLQCYSSRRTTVPNNFETALLLLKENYAKLFWNPCINAEVMAWTSSIYYHFIIWPSSVTLTFNLPEQCFKWHCYSSRTTVPNCFKIHA